MPGYGGYSTQKQSLLVDEDDDADLYEDFNFAIDLAPPQTASNQGYGAGPSRGGYSGQPPTTAFR